MTLGPDSVPGDLSRRLGEVGPDVPLLVCCDFDGTLAPIVTRPMDARPLPGTPELLRDLADHPATTVAVVSGRSLADLRLLSGLGPPVVLVGSHGSEYETGFAEDLTDEQAALYRRLDADLTALVATAPGAELERKPISIAVHVRQASRADAGRVLAAMTEGPVTWPGVHATAGKEVLELAVQRVDKGGAIDRLRPDGGVVLFVGDDVTDERGFAALRDSDIGVKVGPGDTAARYRVPDVPAVGDLLAVVARGREGDQNRS
ncbi:MAG: trehalose-phosphatase [Candidatus Nanopelagicales bacterium]